MTRYAFITGNDDQCGIADYSRQLLDELQQMLPVTPLFFPGVPRSRGRIPLAYPVLAGRFARLASKVNQFQLCHIQHEYALSGSYRPLENLYPWFAANIRIPTVITIHELPDPPYLCADFRQPLMYLARTPAAGLAGRYERYVNGGFAARAARILVHTERHRDMLLAWGIDAARLQVFPHPIPNVTLIPVEPSLPVAWGCSGKRILSIIGFISRRKGYERVLEVMPRLPDDVVLLIAGGSRTAGDRQYEQELRSRVTQTGLSHRVVFTGYLSPSLQKCVLQSSEIILAPFESMAGSGSLSLAIAAGRCILGADISPMHELAEQTGAIALYDGSGSSAMLLSALQKLLLSPQERHRHEQAAVQYAAQHSYQRSAKILREIYHDVLNIPVRQEVALTP